MKTQLLKGDNLELLPTLADNSIDAIVTDPPYELGFMGKSWDSSGIAYKVALWAECLRVLKPGGHLIAFGGSRTYHRLACAVEDAGFEIRDQLMWVYGSGFPKSLDVSKAIDKAAGAERQIVRDEITDLFGTREELRQKPAYGIGANSGVFAGHAAGAMAKETLCATDKAKTWQGWGTALKPSHEPMVLARKPLGEKTVAENVLRWGTGALNIDGTRIPSDDVIPMMSGKAVLGGTSNGYDRPWKNDPLKVAERERRAAEAIDKANAMGRWPANFIHDGSDEVLELFPETKPATESAARFFYCAKASKAERNAGLDHLKAIRHDDGRQDGLPGGDNPRNRTNTPSKNFHPTVKPIALMRYLIRLVTPPNGTVLDPFAGSGTTLVAAIEENVNSIGIELTEDYWPIIEGRTQHALWTRCD